MRPAAFVLLFAMVRPVPAAAQGGSAPPGFDHQKHARVFPTCVTCHEGVATPGQSIWPDPTACASCHDGTIQQRVTWRARVEARRTNLRFSHATHPDSANINCTSCHTNPGESAMAVRPPVIGRCLTCHRVQGEHLATTDAGCATCHVTLAQAASLTRADVAGFPAPPSHRVPGFGGQGHGPPARASVASCAVCHARDFCSSCHVNAPEQRAIQSLAADARSLAIRTTLVAPASHREPAFLERHGSPARKDPQQCSTCHTRESCLACHSGSPRLAAALPAAGPGRGAGAQITRTMPLSHGVVFRDKHGAQAAAAPATCTGCHTRPQCMDCHRPGAASASRGYHPAGFLERHPSAAYVRETSCADCHNPQTFCTSCHVSAGLATRTPLGSGYHDAKRFFLMGHGPAARQNLESCVSCHAERDCVSCHAAQGGRRFNPHGPGFDAERLRRKNPEMCTVCHGLSIPSRS